MTATAARPASDAPGTAPRQAGRRRLGIALAAGAVAVAAAAGTGVAVQNDVRAPITRLTQPLHAVDRIAVAQVKAGQIGTVTANCQPGEVRLGGGFSTVPLAYRSSVSTTPPVDRYPVVANYPASGSESWTTRVANRTDGDTLLVTHVTCTSDPITTTVQFGSADVVGATVRAGCPAGGKVLSGGWIVDGVQRRNQVVEPTLSGPLGFSGGGTAWQAKGDWADRAARSDAVRVRAVALCATSGIGNVTFDSTRLTVPGGPNDQASSADVTATCRYGALTGAGFRRPDAWHALSLTALAPVEAGKATRWGMTEYSLPAPGIDSTDNLGGTSTFLTVCATRPVGPTGVIGIGH